MFKRQFKSLLRSPATVSMLARVIRGYIWLVVATSRVERSVPADTQALMDQHRGFIIVCSHGRIMALAALYTKYGTGQQLYGLHSGHRDGRLVGAVVSGYPNIGTIEGSSSRGGASAIRRIELAIAEGAIVLVTPDGPRGPRLRNRSVVAILAERCGCPIVAMSVGGRRASFLKTWDRFLFLLPFDRLSIVIGGSRLGADKQDVEQMMIEVTQRSDRETGRIVTQPADAKA